MKQLHRVYILLGSVLALTACSYSGRTITVALEGTGSGEILALEESDRTCTLKPGSYNCAFSKYVERDDNKDEPFTRTLTAKPSADSIFVGWSGACSGVAPCTLTVTNIGTTAKVSAQFIKVDYGNLVATDPANDWALSSTFYKNTQIEGHPLTAAGGVDIAITKYSGGGGSLLWVTSFGSGGLDIPNSLQTDNAGNVVLVAQVEGRIALPGGVSLNCSAANSRVMAKFKSNDGSLLWATCIAAQ